jgi:predicted ATPase
MADKTANGMPARIERVMVKNYRALRSVDIEGLSPLSVLLGPNGSGKSTLFDVFAFLSECFSTGLRKAWDKRGRFKELRSRGADDAIVFEVRYRERPENQPITYRLEIDETPEGPFVAREWLRWKRTEEAGSPFYFLDFTKGKGWVISGELPDRRGERTSEQLDSPELLAVNTLGQLTKHPRVAALRRFISGWYLSYLTANNTKGVPEAGPQERLSTTGENLPNVVQYLKERHPERLSSILTALTRRVPRLEKVEADSMPDGRLLLLVKDAPFEKPIMAKFASDGTLKMLAYLTLLYDPSPPPFIGIEEPENQIHPRLLPELAEECRRASEASQLLVTTHSPFFVDVLQPEEVWVLYRDREGYTQAVQVSAIPGVREFIVAGASVGHLWMEGRFGVGDPLVNAGVPTDEA